jgi:hypothetical protein
MLPETLRAEPDCTATLSARLVTPDVVKATTMDCEPVKEPPPRSRPPVAVAASAPVQGPAVKARLSERLVSEQERPLTLKVVAEVVEIETAPEHEL